MPKIEVDVCYIQNYLGLINSDDIIENMHVFGKQEKIDEWLQEQVKQGKEAGYVPEENPELFIGTNDYELTMSKGNDKDGYENYGIVCRPYVVEE